jgi:signal recognition particle subunit SRP14
MTSIAQKHSGNEEVRGLSYTAALLLTVLQFLTRLAALLATTHTTAHGSIFLTQKPLISTDEPSNPPQILVRATNGKSKPHRKLGEKEKMSTIVEAANLAAFYTRYAEVCKKGMEGLRKRDKKKAKKRKAKAGAGTKAG